MNFAFRAYPSHPWLTDWTFEPRGSASAFRERKGECFFQSTDTVGRIAPHVESPQWMLQVPVPQNSRTNMLFNGFCAYFEQRRQKFNAEVFTPEPGVLWGRFNNIPKPVLLSDLPIMETDDYQWIEYDESPVLLATRAATFCLVTNSRIQKDAARLAERYLERNIEEFLKEELEHRAGAASFFEQMTHHDSLAVISTECLMRSLRPAEGKIPLTWSQSAEPGPAHFNVNELYPLAMAWRYIDAGVAEELVLCALKLQVSSGAIPVINAPHGTYSIPEAPKPLIAKTAEMVWQETRNPEFLKAVIPSLRRHVQWLLHHFDPKKRGLHCWQNSGEAFVPHLFESDLASVDLTAMLLSEIDALNRLREHCPANGDTPPYFPDERETIEDNLLNQFWNADDNAFSNGFLRGKVMTVQGFPSFAPLLWKRLPAVYRDSILDRLKTSDFLPGGLNVLSWRTSAMDDEHFPLIQQSVVLQAMQATDPHGTLVSDFARITLQGFVEWHTLSLEENNTLNIAPIEAAYILNVQHTHHYREHAKGRVSGYLFNAFRKLRLDSLDAAVIFVTIFAILGIHSVYNVLHSAPPFGMLEARMNSEYANKNLNKCFRSCQSIIKSYPDQAAEARLLAGNISLFRNDFPTASRLLEEVRTEYPDSPSAMISLGLAYQLQGRFREAEKNYAEFCYLFDQIFPELVERVIRLRLLMQEDFRTPPNWTEIYRYEIMHEL